ncbi:MAG: MgtC/SapB family protein [Pyrinomonadaceae bacterium]|nr:MgtC/SapB family protein [Sphingobacteriaceae bacterium]
MEFTQSDIIKILLSILCGSIIGFEREYQNKTAGFRTIILICLGSTIFTIVSLKMGGSDDRIAANIVTGIGFIGAGVIFKNDFDVKGLTTAAVIWITAAIGMVIGISQYFMGMALAVIVLIILSLFARLEGYIDILNHRIKYSITFINTDLRNLQQVEDLINSLDLKIKGRILSKKDHRLLVIFEISGNKNKIKKLSEKLIGIEEIYQV